MNNIFENGYEVNEEKERPEGNQSTQGYHKLEE